MPADRRERAEDGATSLEHASTLLAAIAGSTEVALFVKDDQGRYRFVNRHCASLWGVSETEIVGRTDAELFPPDIASELRENDCRIMESGKPVRLRECVEFRGKRQIYLSSKVPLVDETGRVYGISGVCSDISDLEQTLDALRESEHRFRQLADSAPVLIWMSGKRKEGVFFNQTWLEYTGRSLEEELGDHWLDAVHPDDLPQLDACARAFEERKPFQTHFRLRRWDGVYRWMLDVGVPRFDSSGEFLGFIGSCTDVSQQIELENKLREQADVLSEADRRKDDFLAHLGHELRNPLAPLRGVVELFRARAEELAPDLRAGVEVADRQLTHVKRLVDDMLDLARLTRDRIQLVREPFPVMRVVRDAVESMRPAFDAKEIEYRVEDVSPSPFVDADEVRLSQVFGNLLHNASKFTPSGGEVIVAVEAQNGWVEVVVRDDGTGIANEDLEKVFDLFQQDGPSLRQDPGGLGLGLALARRLVELHDGRITAESDGPGQGSAFRVRLPTVSHPAPESVETPAPDAPVRQKILVVDDHVDGARMLALLLTHQGHDTEIAHDGRQALSHIESTPFDTVFLDIGLPDLDGYEVGRRIRGRDGDQPFLVALTGFGQESASETIARVGFDRHVLKPIDSATLSEVLAESVRRRSGRGGRS